MPAGERSPASSLDVVPPGRVLAGANRAPTAAPGASATAEGLDETPLDAPAEPELSGQVLSAFSGKPVANALVVADGIGVGMQHTSSRAVSDDSGCFLFETLPTGFSTLTVHAPGQAYAMWFEVNLPLEPTGTCGLVLYVEPAARLFGRVVDEEGRPVEAGEVRAYSELFRGPIDGNIHGEDHDHFSDHEFYGQFHWTFDKRPSAALGESGTFELADLPADKPFFLVVMAPDVARTVVAEDVVVPYGEELELTLVVERAETLRGTLTAPEGRSPGEFGLWVCQHVLRGAVDPRFDGDSHISPGYRGPYGRDLWVPIAADGSFLAGPIRRGRETHLRVSEAEPFLSFATPVTFAADDVLTLPRPLPTGAELTVDLRRFPTYVLESGR